MRVPLLRARRLRSRLPGGACAIANSASAAPAARLKRPHREHAGGGPARAAGAAAPSERAAAKGAGRLRRSI